MLRKVLISLILLSVTMPALADDYVNGYYRSNGTYVQPHYRSSSDYTQTNNYSTRGNYNPYSGQAGTVNVYTPSHNYGINYGRNYGPRSGFSNRYRY